MNEVPNLVRPVNGKSEETQAAFPGITFSEAPFITAVNLSVYYK